MADLSQPLPRAVPETREDGAVVARVLGSGNLIVQARPDGSAFIRIDGWYPGASINVNATELRTCIAALTAVLGQLDPDHPAGSGAL